MQRSPRGQDHVIIRFCCNKWTNIVVGIWGGNGPEGHQASSWDIISK